jgi:hypothetical protein
LGKLIFGLNAIAGYMRTQRLQEAKAVDADNEAGSPGTTGGQQTSGGLDVTVGGAAVAVGQNTSATGDVNLDVVDRPHFTVAHGTAEFTAAATSPTGQTAAADAQTGAAATGADLVLIFTRQGSGYTSASNGNSAYDTSTTNIFALDLKHVDLPGGGIVIEHTVGFTGSAPKMLLRGNYASANSEGFVESGNAMLSTATNALTVENQFSLVDAVAFSTVA